MEQWIVEGYQRVGTSEISFDKEKKTTKQKPHTIEEDHTQKMGTKKGTASSLHTIPSIHMPKKAGNISRMWAEEWFQMLPVFIPRQKPKAARKPQVQHFPVLQLNALSFLRAGIAHAVLYILCKGEGEGNELNSLKSKAGLSSWMLSTAALTSCSLLWKDLQFLIRFQHLSL